MVNRHLPHDLVQMQSVPLEGKILMTQERIRQWYEHWDGQVYVSFSGGKDSTVLKHIVDGMYDDVPALFVNTGLEYPEIQSFVRDIKAEQYDCFNSDVEIVRPTMRFDEVLKRHGYPVVSKEVSYTVQYAKIKDGKPTRCLKKLMGEIQHKTYKHNMQKWSFLLDAPFKCSSNCCFVMKKTPAKKYEKETGRKAIIGTMAYESRERKTAWIKKGCNAFDSARPTSQPMSFWTEQDVLHYIKKFNVPYASVYGDIVVRAEKTEDSVDGQVTIYDLLEEYEEAQLETTGCDRTGCVYCMFGCHLEPEPNRFQRLKKTHPRQYEYCINGGEMVDGKWQPNKEGLGLAKVLDYIGVKYD